MDCTCLLNHPQDLVNNKIISFLRKQPIGKSSVIFRRQCLPGCLHCPRRPRFKFLVSLKHNFVLHEVQDLFSLIFGLDASNITPGDPTAPRRALTVSIRSEIISKSTFAVLRNVSFKIWTIPKLNGIDSAVHGHFNHYRQSQYNMRFWHISNFC